jgi:hypothetical protein
MKFRNLNDIEILYNIPKNATGVYFLANGKIDTPLIKYIGRSDTRLRERLLDHFKRKKYSFFSFQITDTLLEAYRIECREWHNAIDLDNKIHPKIPKNLSYKCPYCIGKKGGYVECHLREKK